MSQINYNNAPAGLLDFKLRFPAQVVQRFISSSLSGNVALDPCHSILPTNNIPNNAYPEALSSSLLLLGKTDSGLHSNDRRNEKEKVQRKGDKIISGNCNGEAWLLSRYKLISALCMLCLFPFILDIFGQSYSTKQRWGGCLYILISPVTLPSICLFNLLHKNSKMTSIGMALGAVILGNIASMLHCAPCVCPKMSSSNSQSNINNTTTQAESWSGAMYSSGVQGIDIGSICLSLALILGTLQLLMLMNKKNIAIVMISTASTVVVCGLSAAAPFLNVSLSRKCYQTCIPCIVWIFWQATQSHIFSTVSSLNQDVNPQSF